MKKTVLYFIFLFSLCSESLRSQTELYSNIVVNTIAANYTVNAVNDTTFERELVITLIDTLSFQSLDATLSIKADTVWQTVQNENLGASALQETSCSTVFCFYRRQRNVWVLVLGNYSLFTRHRIELHFNSNLGASSYDNFSNEF